MDFRFGFFGKVLVFSLVGILCLGVWPVDAASGLAVMDAGKVVTVNTPCADLEVNFPNGWATGQWRDVPVSLELVAPEDPDAAGFPAFPGECGGYSVLRFRNLVKNPGKVGETRVYPNRDFFEGLESSVLYRLEGQDGADSCWHQVSGWLTETPGESRWSFRFDGAEEMVFLLCCVEEPVVPGTSLSGTDWQLFWAANCEKWWERDEPILTFMEGPAEDPGAVYFTLSSGGEWDAIDSLDLYLYFETDPSAGLCLFHRAGSDGDWLPWNLPGLVEVRPDEAAGWLEGYGFRVHLTFPNEMIASLVPLNGIRFRLGSCVVPGVVNGDFDGEAPLWKLVFRACSEDRDASVGLVPYSPDAGDLDGLGEEERAVLEGMIDSLFFFRLFETGCIEALEASFLFGCDALQEEERYYLWAIDADGEEVVLTPLPDDLTGWAVPDEPLLEGDRTFCYRLWADLSGYPFDTDTLFVLAPVGPEELGAGGGPGDEGNDEGAGGGGCSIGGVSSLFLLLVPLSMLFRR